MGGVKFGDDGWMYWGSSEREEAHFGGWTSKTMLEMGRIADDKSDLLGFYKWYHDAGAGNGFSSIATIGRQQPTNV